MPEIRITDADWQSRRFFDARWHERQRFPAGEEVIAHFDAPKLTAFAMARQAARIYAGLVLPNGEWLSVVPCVKWPKAKTEHFPGHVIGSQTADGKQGWRIDVNDDADRPEPFHVNWWDARGETGRGHRGKDRAARRYGKNYVTGGDKDLFWQVLAHFPGQIVKPTRG